MNFIASSNRANVRRRSDAADPIGRRFDAAIRIVGLALPVGPARDCDPA
jgi:hypothetical protein